MNTTRISRMLLLLIVGLLAGPAVAADGVNENPKTPLDCLIEGNQTYEECLNAKALTFEKREINLPKDLEFEGMDLPAVEWGLGSLWLPSPTELILNDLRAR